MSGDDRFDDAELALAGRLTTLLADRAGALVVGDERFDPTRRSDLALDDGSVHMRPTALAAPSAPDGGGPDGRDGRGASALEPLPIDRDGPAARRWLVWVAGVAAAAVLVAALVMVNAVRQPTVQVVDDPMTLLVDNDGALMPTWVPEGYELWAIAVQPAQGPDARRFDPTTARKVAPLTQLVETIDSSARFLVSVGGDADAMVNAGPATPTTIRGTTGWSRTVAIGGDEWTQFGWSEAGQDVDVTVTHAHAAAAQAMLERLEPVDPADLGAGFAPPADGSATVRTDDQRGADDTLGVMASFGYSVDRPAGSRTALEVATFGPTSGTLDASLGHPGYLVVGFRGEVRPDGVAVSSSVDPGGGSGLLAVWPDGRRVFVSGALDLEEAEQVADRVQLVSAPELERAAVRANERVGDGPVVARAALGAGTVEVIGDGAPEALCITVGSHRRCSLSERLDVRGGLHPQGRFGAATVLVDGRWYVFGANEGPVDVTVELGGDGAGETTGTGPPDPSVRPDTATDGSWTVAVLAVPSGFDRATIDFGDSSMGVMRPLA